MTRKTKINISSSQKLKYAKLMVDEGYTNKQIQELEKQLKRAQRDNEILKKAAAFFIRYNPSLN